MKLSEEMLKAGWVIKRKDDGSFHVWGSRMQEFHYEAASSTWSADPELISELVRRDLEHRHDQPGLNPTSPIVISSRLTALNHSKNVSQPVKYLCRQGLVRNKTILHLGSGLDRFARRELLSAGCLEVMDYDPNFQSDESVLNRKYDGVMAHYVLNILTPVERRDVYRLIERSLSPGGRAWLTVQGVWPVENQYDIIKPFEDGYLIKTGYNSTFRKGYTSQAFLREIREELGGSPKELTSFYSNTMAEWVKSDR